MNKFLFSPVRLGRLFLLSLLGFGLVHAQTVSVNFKGPGGPVTGTTGVVAAANWNNIDSSFPPGGGIAGSGTGLLNNLGATTSLGLNYTASAYYNAAISGGTEDDRTLLNSFIYGSTSNPLAINVTGLDGLFSGAYDVYVYFANPNDFHVIGYTLAGSTAYTRTMANFDFNTTGWLEGKTAALPASYDLVPQGDYVKFSGVTGASFTLQAFAPAISGSGLNYNAVSGLQITAASSGAIPEPATAGVWLGLGVMAAGIYRRCRGVAR